MSAAMTEIEALALSAAIEASIAYLVMLLARWPSRGNLHVAAASAAATAITHPQLWGTIRLTYQDTKSSMNRADAITLSPGLSKSLGFDSPLVVRTVSR